MKHFIIYGNGKVANGKDNIMGGKATIIYTHFNLFCLKYLQRTRTSNILCGYNFFNI